MILIVKDERSPACNSTYPKVAVQWLDQVCASIKVLICIQLIHQNHFFGFEEVFCVNT